MKTSLCLGIALAMAVSTTASAGAARDGLDYDQMLTALKGDGLQGEVHGAVEGQGLFVLTVRAPDDFFTHAEFPLVADQAAAAETLRHLSRHDIVKIKGDWVQNHAPIHHILVKEVVMVKKYETTPAMGHYDYQVQVPHDLGDSGTAVFKVHASAGEGHVLVVEYKDVILPVFVKDAAQAATAAALWRGDRIRLAYNVREYPEQPVHLEPNKTVADALTVVSRVQDLHGKPASVTGVLTQFPKSPQVMFDIYAIETTDADGLYTDYTLINFDDPAVFTAIRNKLGAAWAAHVASAKQSRNRWVNPQIRITATGIFNEVDPGQANPQILLKSASDVTLNIE
ncbi:MAG TPA: hypothetical protein VL588_05375 [Bdellovibrionota bacterium]|nr:hypothetical protein [Bdellovibrionota bacterium]